MSAAPKVKAFPPDATTRRRAHPTIAFANAQRERQAKAAVRRALRERDECRRRRESA
jgi:hypothetical protein